MSAVEAVVLVDGTNVLHCAAWRRSSPELVNEVASWASGEGVEVVLVFDGSIERSRPVGPVVVVASGVAEADDVIAEQATQLAQRGIAHWVVSDDRVVRSTAGARADRVIGADDFVLLLQGDAAARKDAASAADAASGSRIGDGLDDAARARLERMRRGH